VFRLVVIIFIVNTFIAKANAGDTFILHGQIQFSDDGMGYGGSDVWGYTTSEGEDVAIMGILEGVVFIRAEDMAIIDTVLGPMGGDPYYHRDIKTFDHYAYVVSENTGTNEGLQIIDLSGLPESVELVDTYSYNNHVRSHNMSIDTATGFAYICAQTYEGFRVVDINDPENPSDVNFVYTETIHDVFAQNDLVYVAEGWRGTFSIYDLSDKSNPALLARVSIPNNGYVHNIWPSDDGNFVVTTEESVPKTVKIWSIEDSDNIHVVGEYLGDNLVAHNAQVLGTRIFLSHYTYGMVIVDYSDPFDPIEAAHFDTYPQHDEPSPPWHGNWGIFQYTENGYVYGSDLDGLFTVMIYQKGLDHGVLYGDVNEDQIVNAMDVAFLVNVVLKDQNLTETQWIRSDLNFDDTIDIFDIFHLIDLISEN
jgi:choice-of-anchor B domain-containing protein